MHSMTPHPSEIAFYRNHNYRVLSMSNTTDSTTDNLEALAASILADHNRLVAAFKGEAPTELAKGPGLVAILKRANESLEAQLAE